MSNLATQFGAPNAWGGQTPQQMTMQERERKRKALQATGNRWGQQQGYGQGYMAPRRQVGGQHTPAQERIGAGYNARTAGQMYGGRPTENAMPATNARGVPEGYRGQQGGYGGIGPTNIVPTSQQLAAQNKYRGVGQPSQQQPQLQRDPNYVPPPALGPGGVQQQPQYPYQQNQMQAMTRQANTARAQITRPYGGTNAVQRGRFQATNRRW